MATSVIMPALEMAQETGKLVKWYKREGETITRGELLLAIETDKAVLELEAEASGILAAVRAQLRYLRHRRPDLYGPLTKEEIADGVAAIPAHRV